MPLTALLALLLLLLPLSFAQIHLGYGPSCQLGLPGPSPCTGAAVCELTNFGNPAAGQPRTGRCRAYLTTPPPCTVAFCATNGGTTACSVTTPEPLIATCRAWGERMDPGGVGPDCNFPCTRECRSPRVVASNGDKYCNLCDLHSASCRRSFRFYGPRDPCRVRPIAESIVAKCCIEKGRGCLRVANRCSTLGSRTPPAVCEPELKCVISDFGFPRRNVPNRGRCLPASAGSKCSVRRCTRFGPKHICAVPLPRGREIVSRCRAWAKRSDGEPGPDCSFSCPRVCAVGDARPLASNGKRFCSICHLRQKSCATGFRVFGPVRP